MSMRRKTRAFFLILVDHDKRVFNVVGPISDDTDWTHRIDELQKVGRNVNCFSSSDNKSIDDIIDSYSEQTGYTFSHDSIADEPENSSFIFKGVLPNYAENADRKRVVKILCKGRCGTIRWAEMNVNYPRQQVLRDSDFGDFTATCLHCGQQASEQMGSNLYS